MTTLRTLMVEDSEDDALLVQEALRNGGYEVHILRVETENALRQALQDEPWDIVLSDYCLPSFDARGTLAILKESGLDLPVIVISGTVGEEVAVETLKLGAENYLLKQNLTRLVPAVARSLEAVEGRRQHRKLEHMKTVILENSLDLICTFDTQGRFLEISAAAKTVLDYEPAELVGVRFEQLAHPDDVASVLDEFRAVLRGQRIRDLECRFIRKGGQAVHLTWSAVLSKAEGVIVGVGRDITDRKQKDEALRRVEDNIRRERALLRTLIDSIPDLIFFKDKNFVFLGCNRSFENHLGIPESRLIGKTDFDIVPAEWANYYREQDQKLFASGQPQRSEEQIPRRDGRTGIFDTIKTPFYGPDGELLGLLGVSRDIAERKHMEEALREETARFRAQVDCSPDGILVVDNHGKKVIQNERFSELWKIPPEIAANPDDAPQLEFSISQTKDPPETAAMVARLQAHPEEAIHDEVELVDGTVLDRYSGPVLDKDGCYYGRIWAFRDITDRRQAEQRIRYLATHDDLTGLPNRNLIQDRIVQAIAHARRTGRQLALLYLDLDRFKVINDGYGHPFGDAVLKATGERLLTLVREGDTVARQGGDEFLILLTDLRKASDAYLVAQKIVENLDAPVVVEDRVIHLCGSIGVSVFPQDGETAEALIGNADVAMYRAKDLGRNTCQFFTREMSEETQRRVDLETSLRGAAAAGQLQLAYQPKVSLESGCITGCEALLRWHHPELGAVSPCHFIPIAEDSGLIVPIGDWVLRTACAQAKAWLDAGLPPVRVAVNISARQFLQQDVVAWVMGTLQKTGLPAAQLELEFTESLIAQDVEKVITTFSQLRAAGVKLSIDDFGTGYSSLSYLKRFRVDALKIDQSFVRDMLTDPEDATIVLAVIALAHNLEFKVIAEGVETERHCRVLRQNHCDEIQGYYFSRPIPAAEFEAMLRGGKQLTCCS